MERKIFQKAKLATAIALVSTTTLLTGCLVDGDKSNTTSTTIQEDASRISVTDQATPRAEILGIVQDTNGNAVAGARVSIGGTTVTTNVNGAYSIQNVAVTGFTGGAGAAAATPIQVSIVPASSTSGTNYLSATVSVTPQASTIVQTIDGASGNTENALLAIVTTDGLAVSAGVTVIPALKSTVTGVLHDAETGETVKNAIIGLELLEVNGVIQQQVQNSNGAGTSYGVATYQAATDSEGKFVFNNLPSDSDFDIAIEDWKYEALVGSGNIGNVNSGEFATTDENTTQNIGTITAKRITSRDSIAPFVTTVNGVVVNALTGLLNDDLDGTQGLTINFSEPLQQIVDDNSIHVYNTTLNSVVDVVSYALSTDGTSLTLTTANPIAQNQEFEIYLSVVDFQDLEGNVIIDTSVVNANDEFRGVDTPKYDSIGGVTSVGTLKLSLKTFSDPITVAGAVVGLTQLLGDGGNSDFGVLQALNSTFSDVDTGSIRVSDVTIEQLNEPEAAARLGKLAATTYSESGLTTVLTDTDVKTDVARVQFNIDSTTEAVNYIITLTSASGVAKPLSVETTAQVGTVTNNNSNNVALTLTDGFTGIADLLLVGVTPNDTVTISSLTSFGTIDGTVTLPLTDQVAPTTVLQNSYGQGLKSNATVGLNYGDGGELADLTPAAVGAPLLNITPRLLTPQVGETLSLPVAKTWESIKELMQDVDSTGTKDVDLSNMSTGYTAYDKTAYDAWTVGSRKIGIAVSEDVSLTSTAPVITTSQLLSGWTVQNDVLINDQQGPSLTDLINVTVPDVIKFANDDHGKTIDFTGAISDNSGNVAAAENNAQVVVRDLMPPLLTSAIYTGEEIQLTYNEDVVVPEGTVFTLDGATNLGIINITTTSTNTTVSGNTVTLSRLDFLNLDSESVFDRGTFDHDNDNDSNTVDRAHSVIYSKDVEDARGTSWANWDGATGLVDIPGIAIRDDAGDFQLNTSQTTYPAASSFTVTYRFSHRIDLSNSGLGIEVTDNLMTGSEVASAFALSNIVIDQTSSASLDLTGRVLTVNIVAASNGSVTGETLTLQPGFAIISEWDTNDTALTSLGSVTAP